MNPNKGGYYITKEGERVYFVDLAEAIKKHHPHLVGKHIFQQLEALKRWKEFREGTTPVGLPYSFSSSINPKFQRMEYTDYENACWRMA